MNDYMWIRVDKEGECPTLPCFISDAFENVYQAHCSFDYYDADYWFPMPVYPEEDE